ncbi:MAG: hypothetical protein ACTHU0_33070, partial [Kofleriaceae bacterium]
DAPLPPESDPALAVTDAAVPHEGDSLIGTSVGRYRVLARVGAAARAMASPRGWSLCRAFPATVNVIP